MKSKRLDLPTGEDRCAGPHRWGGEVLHTLLPDGIVTVRVCSLCGLVSARRSRPKAQQLANEVQETERPQ